MAADRSRTIESPPSLQCPQSQYLLTRAVSVFMGEDWRAEAPAGMLLRRRRGRSWPLRWLAPGLAPRAARRSCCGCRLPCAVRSAVARAVERCMCNVGSTLPHSGSCTRSLRVHSGAACAPRGTPPKTSGGCNWMYWSSVGSYMWTDRLSFGPALATGRSGRTVGMFAALYVIARGVGSRVACVSDHLAVCTACVSQGCV